MCTFFLLQRQTYLNTRAQQRILGIFDHIATANAVLTYTSKCHFHAQRLESNTTRRGERYLCTPLFVCQMWSPFHLNSSLLKEPWPISSPFIFVLLCDCAMRKLCGQTPDKATDYILNRAGIFFTFSLNVYIFCLR